MPNGAVSDHAHREQRAGDFVDHDALGVFDAHGFGHFVRGPDADCGDADDRGQVNREGQEA